MADTIEKKVAQTILQMPTEIQVGQKTYKVAPPSVATIILVSRYTAEMPRLQLDDKRVIEDTLRHGKECAPLGNIIATLILGAKAIKADVAKRESLWGKVKRWLGLGGKSLMERTASAILEDMTPREVYAAAMQLLSGMQVTDFFGLSTFLCEINLTKPTKVD